MKKEQYSTIITISMCLLLSGIHCPLFDIFFDDKEIFKYTGLVILKGGVPYKDFFDHKPPLIFFLNYAGLLLGSWGLWIIDTLLVLFSSLLFLSICKKKLSYPWLLPSLFNIFLRAPAISNGIGMTREYTTIFLIIFFCIMLGQIRYKYFLLGLISGLIFFMQQDQILLFLPFLLYTLFKDAGYRYGLLAKNVLIYSAGVLCIAFPILIYFLANQSLKYFWQDAFLFNFNWYTEKMPFMQQLDAIGKTLWQTGYALPFYGSFFLGIASLIYGNEKKSLLIAGLSALLFSFCSEYLSGKLILGLSVSYYLLPLAATIPILVFIVFGFDHKLFAYKRKPYQLIYGILLSATVCLNIARYVHYLSGKAQHASYTQAEEAFFEKIPLRDFDLYIFYNSNAVYIYNRHKILSPSKWIYHYFWHWYDNWDPDNQKLESITEELMQHRTAFILDYSNEVTFKNKKNYVYWKAFLQKNYTPLPLDTKKVILWKLK